MTMKTIAAAKFKEQCLSLLDSVGPEGITITKRGKPVAKLVPLGRDGKTLIGSLKESVKILGDIKSTGVAWAADAKP